MKYQLPLSSFFPFYQVPSSTSLIILPSDALSPILYFCLNLPEKSLSLKVVFAFFAESKLRTDWGLANNSWLLISGTLMPYFYNVLLASLTSLCFTASGSI